MSEHEVIIDESTSEYQCTCPPTDDPDEEIALAIDCWAREQAWGATHQQPDDAQDGG